MNSFQENSEFCIFTHSFTNNVIVIEILLYWFYKSRWTYNEPEITRYLFNKGIIPALLSNKRSVLSQTRPWIRWTFWLLLLPSGWRV